jgi:hypothetical protein
LYCCAVSIHKITIASIPTSMYCAMDTMMCVSSRCSAVGLFSFVTLFNVN